MKSPNNKPFEVSFTPGTSAYGDGDVVGGVLTFNCLGTPAPTDGVITHLTLSENDNEGSDFVLWLFDSVPTTIADNAALALAIADLQNSMGTIAIAAADYATNNSLKIATVILSNPISFWRSTLYGYLVTDGTTPTFSASRTIKIRLHVQGYS